MKNDLKKKEFSINSDVSITDIEKANERLKSLTIKVLTNKKNADVKIDFINIHNGYKKYETKAKYFIYFYKYEPEFLSDYDIWQFDTKEERDRIYEKIKPYFEFKEVEEIEID